MNRRYSIIVDGFDGVTFVASSAGAARYAAWKAFRDAGYGHRWSFSDFLRATTTLHMGASSSSPAKEPSNG